MVIIQADIIKRCKKAEKPAQKHLFEKLYGPMYRVCLRYLASQAEAEDCLMRGMMKAFQKIDGFEYTGEYSFFAWLRSIVVNECLMEIRRKNYLMLVPEEYASDIHDGHDIISALSAEELFEMIANLPTGYRTVFNLYVIEGFAHSEIAEKLDITESTSRTQLAKARNSLKIMITQSEIRYGTNG